MSVYAASAAVKFRILGQLLTVPGPLVGKVGRKLAPTEAGQSQQSAALRRSSCGTKPPTSPATRTHEGRANTAAAYVLVSSQLLIFGHWPQPHFLPPTVV